MKVTIKEEERVTYVPSMTIDGGGKEFRIEECVNGIRIALGEEAKNKGKEFEIRPLSKDVIYISQK